MDLYPDKVVVGLTGGIASGKTLALGFFEKHGWHAISTDKLASNVLEEEKIVIDAIEGRWGLDQGNIDKSKIQFFLHAFDVSFYFAISYR